MSVKPRRVNVRAPYDIQLRDDARSHGVSASQIKKAAAGILKTLGWKKAAVSVWLVTDRKIRTINREFLNHDYATDVISFSQIEGKKVTRGEGSVPFLGDLVISLDTTARQAKAYGNDFFYELCFYVCHGILHVMGHDDHTPKQAKWMHDKQAAVLKKLGVKNKKAS